jgi:hypothetical protein
MVRGVTVIDAVPVAPEPLAALAVSVAVPAEVPAVKKQEVVILQVGILPSPVTVQLAERFELNASEVPSSIVWEDGVTLKVGVEETVIVTFVDMVVSLLVSCACKTMTCDPTASDVTV